MNIDERFEKLEKQIKTLKKMLGGVAALALAALIGGTAMGVHAANGKFDTLTAKTIYVKDSSGKKRITLSGALGNIYLMNFRGINKIKLEGTSGNAWAKEYNKFNR